MPRRLIKANRRSSILFISESCFPYILGPHSRWNWRLSECKIQSIYGLLSCLCVCTTLMQKESIPYEYTNSAKGKKRLTYISFYILLHICSYLNSGCTHAIIYQMKLYVCHVIEYDKKDVVFAIRAGLRLLYKCNISQVNISKVVSICLQGKLCSISGGGWKNLTTDHSNDESRYLLCAPLTTHALNVHKENICSGEFAWSNTLIYSANLRSLPSILNFLELKADYTVLLWHYHKYYFHYSFNIPINFM